MYTCKYILQDYSNRFIRIHISAHETVGRCVKFIFTPVLFDKITDDLKLKITNAILWINLQECQLIQFNAQC